MKKQMYALYDTTVKTFMNTIHFINDGEAVRWLTTVVNDKEKTNVSLYPVQFILYRLGTFDDQTGEFNNEQKEVMQAIAVRQESPQYTLEELFKEKQQLQQ